MHHVNIALTAGNRKEDMKYFYKDIETTLKQCHLQEKTIIQNDDVKLEIREGRTPDIAGLLAWTKETIEETSW